MTTPKIVGLGLVFALASFKASAQSREVPGVAPIIRPGTTALMQYHTVPKFTIMQSRNQQYLINADGLKHMKADWVTTTRVLKDSAAVNLYGNAAAKGVAICVLNDVSHPEAFKTLRPYLMPLKSKGKG